MALCRICYEEADYQNCRCRDEYNRLIASGLKPPPGVSDDTFCFANWHERREQIMDEIEAGLSNEEIKKNDDKFWADAERRQQNIRKMIKEYEDRSKVYERLKKLERG